MSIIHSYPNSHDVEDDSAGVRPYTEALDRGGQHQNWPIFVYYRANRGTTYQQVRGYGGARRQTEAYLDALEAGPAQFDVFVAWFAEEESLENEVRLEKDAAWRSPRLAPVRDAVRRLLTIIAGEPLGELRVRRARHGRSAHDVERVSPTLMLRRHDGSELDVTQLSDGERGVLLIGADIARRLSLACPGLDNPLEGGGIVLIDELELHLHPRWQRTIVGALAEVFPNVQFCLTTHSPQVLSGSLDRSLVLLDQGRVISQPFRVHGRDSNSILMDMGVAEFPDAAEQLRVRVAVAIDGDDLDGARAALSGLEETLGPDHAEVVRLRTLIEFLEL